MIRHLIIFFILTVGFTFCGYGQKNFKIQGSWECYTSLSDTINSENVLLWYFFDNSKVSVLLVPSYGLPPEKAGIKTTEKYKFKNDTLRTFHKNLTNIALVSVLNNNLISIRPIDSEEKEKFYLKRVIKK